MHSPAALPDSPLVAPGSGWWAVCLCANWCGTCRDYRPLFDDLARAHPQMRFVWVDMKTMQTWPVTWMWKLFPPC